MSDLIERETAISYAISGEIRREDGENWIRTREVRQSLLDMPSAQPKKRTEKRTGTHSCDLISRQAAMEEISKQQTYKMFEGEDTLYLDANDVGSVLASLPSAQPEVLACGEGELIAQPEIVRCKDCMYWVAHDKRCVYLNHGFAPNMWCCHGRRTDE